MKIIILLFHFVIFICIIDAVPIPTSTYTNKIVLVEPEKYILYWNYTQTDIIFEIHVKATGWIGFGLSPNGDMLHSDVILAWVDSKGNANFTDRHVGKQRSTPTVDTVQNWFSLLTIAKDGYTISKFTRKIKLCDTTGEDLNIETGTPYLIFAWGDISDNNEASYHGSTNRGSKTVPLISSANSKPKINMNEVETVEFRVNVNKCFLFFSKINQHKYDQFINQNFYY